jgi:hypothetical protein
MILLHMVLDLNFFDISKCCFSKAFHMMIVLRFTKSLGNNYAKKLTSNENALEASQKIM